MTASLVEWDKAGIKLTSLDKSQECDYKLDDLRDSYFQVLGIQGEEIGKYGASILSIKASPDKEPQTLFSSSKVINEQARNLRSQSAFPVLVKLIKVKNYYTFE